MQEHPIPQDVTSYKFHIVGNMTLKQFAEVGAGVLVAVILYNTNLLAFIKWPLILFSVGLGGMMAFVPIEERPLDHWIMTFFRRLYSPTKFYWRKESEVPFAMAPEKQQKKQEEPAFEMDLTPARQQRIREYIESVKQPEPVEPWESTQSSRVSEILQTFDEVVVGRVKAKPQAVKPPLTPRIRTLSLSQKPPVQKQVVFQAPTALDKQIDEQIASQTNEATEIKPIVPPLSSPSLISLKNLETELPPQPVEIFGETETKPVEPPLQDDTPYAQPSSEVTTNAQLPFPQQDLAPNTIMGMTLTPDNKLVDRATVSIKNARGEVLRSLRTNLLGQFFVTDALANGTYIIAVEKAGLSFPEQTIALNGSVLQPVELRAA